MLQRGDFVVERLTGKRAIVIHVSGEEEITCRFADGRLEDRFAFELETPASLVGSFLALLATPFGSRPGKPPAVERVRPMIVRHPSAS